MQDEKDSGLNSMNVL